MQAEEKEQKMSGLSFAAELLLFCEFAGLLASRWLSKETKKCWHFATPKTKQNSFLSLKKGEIDGLQ